MLQLRSVTKRYGSITALDGVSLDIVRGEFFGLLGPNGAGKSTVMSLVAGLRAPEAGTIAVNGVPLTAAEPSTRLALGLVPQHLALYPELSAEENLRIFGELYHLRGADLRVRIADALAAVGLADRRRDAVKTFSGGMQRRLNLIAALLHRPKLLLCDEPTVGIDPQSRNAIFEYLERLNREGLTIIYSTHYMEEATRLCSRIGIIDHGKLHALGTLDELLTRLPFEEEIRFPAAPATADLFSKIVRIETEQVVGTKVKNPMATALVGGWAIQFLLFALSASATSMFRERDAGIFQRLLAAPVTRANILWSKFLYGVILGLVQLLVLFVASGTFFGIEVLPHFGLLALVCVFAAAACTSFGMLLAAISPNAEAANGLATFLIMLMSGIGGAWFPITLMPVFIQQFSKLTLVYWSMEGFSQVLWSGHSLVQLLPTLGILLGITGAVMALALWRFNRGRLFE